ncbi:MAG TPA: NADH-quinone oxidoreductase subunit M [Verrucomicrobiales bacterium]|nr:NADH-quinone oxidoreductase subunit M [Verrucomicrobiales bacterium]
MLTWTIYISFLGMTVLMCLPKGRPQIARLTALATAALGLVFGLAGASGFAAGDGVKTLVNAPWVPALGINYHLAVDGISLTMIVLTGVAAVAGVLFSWNVEQRPKDFFAFYFALIGGCYGVFLSFDLFLLFVFYEIAIVPKYFLIAAWGSTNREYGAMKLALYSFASSALVLLGIIAAHVISGAESFSLVDLAGHPFSEGQQAWLFPLVFVGFAVLAGMWPFHTWAPTGHVAAPTAASMLLAGIVMKLGAYGCLRVAMTLFPLGLQIWSPYLGALAVIGIVHGALVALAQKDFKFVIGYSSVSHMGFVLLGLLSLSMVGMHGAVLQMFSHGVIAGLLFAVVGRMVYDRTHTRELDELQLMRLKKALPYAAVVFAMAGFASMGMPGFSGFIAEFQVLIGAWHGFSAYAILAGLGVVIGVAYTLRAMQKSFYPDRSGLFAGKHDDPQLAPITWQEKAGATLLLACTVAVGFFPRLLLDWIAPALEAPLFDGLRKGVGL